MSKHYSYYYVHLNLLSAATEAENVYIVNCTILCPRVYNE